tara:strand:- start:489 stop:686 length:198 start_codon:yes stop_codon:yes gene_type:complete
MKFYIPINVVEEGGSQTMDILDTNTTCKRTNKKLLRSYFIQKGIPKYDVKRVMKAMGFWGDRLGV